MTPPLESPPRRGPGYTPQVEGRSHRCYRGFAAPALAAGAGLAFALALPGPGLAPFVLLFPVLLLEAVEASRTVRGAALAGWAGGTVHWMVATNWVVPVMRDYGGLPTVLAVLCLVGMAAILASTWALATGLVRLVRPPLRPLALASAWALTEALREGPLFRFPWNPVAAVAADRPVLLGSLPVWGAMGLGWALVLAGGGLHAMLRPGTRRAGLVSVATALALTMVAGLAAPRPRCEKTAVRVALLQPGSTLEEGWNPARAGNLLRRVETLTRRAAAAGARLVLWPESAVPGSLERSPGLDAWVQRIARETGVTIVLESIGWNDAGQPTNAAHVVTPEGREPQRYDKVHLVPFGEYVPWWARWGFTRGLVREVGSFVPGRRAVPLPTPEGPIGVAICYEIVFPGLVAREVRAGASFLVTLTNDGWYGYSWAPHQHFAQAVLRAAETRRWVLRAALTGISGAVDPTGRVAARMGVGKQGMLLVAVRRCSRQTPRVRFGDWWVWVALGLLTASLVAGIPVE